MRALIPQRTASALFSALLLAGVGIGQTTERVSVDSLGVEGNRESRVPSISASGRFIAFQSKATNLVFGGSSGLNIFVHDRQNGRTILVSVSSSGVEGNYASYDPSISSDGSQVGFWSEADNLVPGDTNGLRDIFVHDCKTGVTDRVSISSLGEEANGNSEAASVSKNGRYVAFQSQADNLVTGDYNGRRDIFVHDRKTGMTERVSVDSNGVEANSGGDIPAISANGRYVAFQSHSDNLVPGDTNSKTDIFAHDRLTGATERVSVDSAGLQAGKDNYFPFISADGRYVVFSSEASNLVPGDTNRSIDAFVHDRLSGVTRRISVSSSGAEGSMPSYGGAISAHGRYVTFESEASQLVLGDTNSDRDIFVHDRYSGVTERVSVNSLGADGKRGSWFTSISSGGRYVAFTSWADNLVPGDTGRAADIFVHDRWDGLGQNSIYLSGPARAPVGAPVDFTWQSTRGGSQYWLLYSKNINGTRIDGHKFDLGYPGALLARGVNSTNGLGSHTSSPFPPRAVGYTIYFEVAARDENGVAYDSNAIGVTFQ
jgi:WD40 repeat protein